jgi:ATPase subunit of ABC transporter with duplicated ATPase domains
MRRACCGATVIDMEHTVAPAHDTRLVPGSEPAPPVVAVRDLTKRFGSRVAVDALTFTLEAGSITGFLGPNGAGKTTTLRLLLGLARPTGGQALVFGHPYRHLPNPTRRVGALLESGDFDPGRSGRNHLIEEAVAAATADDLDPLERLLDAVTTPYDERPGLEHYAAPAPDDFGSYQTFCGT